MQDLADQWMILLFYSKGNRTSLDKVLGAGMSGLDLDEYWAIIKDSENFYERY